MADHNTLKHVFTSAVPDDPDASLVRPSNWNKEHIFSGGSLDTYLMWDAAQTDKVSFNNIWERFDSIDITKAPYNADNTGVVDASAIITTAIATGRSINFGTGTYKIGTKLVFNQSNVAYFGKNATLLFNGANSTRLADVSGDDISFYGLKFDGNLTQPNGALVYLLENTERFSAYKCYFQNCTGTAYGTNQLNIMPAVLINPYGVSDFSFRDCVFRNLLKYNDGTYITPAVGLGGTCGIFFYPVDYVTPSVAQTVLTNGVIEGCSFQNIQTILQGGLSEADRVEFDDGEGVRFPGATNVVLYLPVLIDNCYFEDCSKRAVKMSNSSGAMVTNCTVRSGSLPYGMVSLIKTDDDSYVSNIRGYATVSKPILKVIQFQGGHNSHVENVEVDYCVVGVEILNPIVGINLHDVSFSELYFPNCTEVGFLLNNSLAAPATQSSIRLSNSVFICTGTTATGIEGQSATDSTGGLEISNVTITNGDVKLTGSNNIINNLKLEIASNTYQGTSTSRGLFEIGTVGPNYINGLNILISDISPTYVNATRVRLMSMLGNDLNLNGFSLKVPETLSVTYPHCEFSGTDLILNNVSYDGPGSIFVGSVLAVDRAVLNNWTRLGDDACTTVFIFTSHANTQYLYMNSITDFRPTNTYTIRFNGGNGHNLIYNVASRTSGGTIVFTGGLATVVNATLFP